MDVNIAQAEGPLPVDRAWAVSMVIKSFKGRRDVEVHLFRPSWDPAEEADYDWDVLVAPPDDPNPPNGRADPLEARKVLMEAFTQAELDRILDYLKEHYLDRLACVTACTLDVPLPCGLAPLSALSEGKTIGFIRFEKIPNFDLPFPIRGFYDLARHQPLVQD